MAVLLYANKVAAIMTLVGAQYFRRGINRELLAVRFTSTNYFVNWRASSNPDFIQNYFLVKRMFDFFDNRDKYRKPAFLRGNMYTS